MKALVALTTDKSDNVNIKMILKLLKSFSQQPIKFLQSKEDNKSAEKSNIFILPVHVYGLEFETDSKISNELLTVIDNNQKNLFDFSYDGTKVKITSKIVTFELNKETPRENNANTLTESGLMSVTSNSLIDGVINYSKMSSDEQKRFRQKSGKKLIEYASNLTVMNQLTTWLLENDGVDSEILKKRKSSDPIKAFCKTTKSLTILYFKDPEPVASKKDSETDGVGSSQDVDKRVEYMQYEERLNEINKDIGDLDSKINGVLTKRGERINAKNRWLKKYGSETAVSQRKSELETKALSSSLTQFEQNELDELDYVVNEIKYEQETLEELNKYRGQQNALLEEKESIQKDSLKGQSNFEAYQKQEDIKTWTENLLGIELGLPIRYMYIPEVEIERYSESLALSEKSEGTFELILRQSTKRSQYVQIGDAMSLAWKQTGKFLDKVVDIFSGEKDSGGSSGNKN